MTSHEGSSDNWKIAPLLKTTEEYFKGKGVCSPRLDAEVLLAKTLQCERINLYTDFEKILTDEELSAYRNLVKRRASLEPVAYILGEKEFFSLPFKVNKNVLVPRPETENLVEEIITAAEKYFPKKHPLKILDIGTGSGCIAVSLAKIIEKAKVVATEISKDALNTAAINSVLNKVDDRIEFRHGDIFSPVTGIKFDIIVSNPPYIAKDDTEVMDDVRKFEPHEALFADDNGLAIYRKIIAECRDYLNEKGSVFFECGEKQAGAIEKLFRETGFSECKIFLDHAGKKRIVAASTFPMTDKNNNPSDIRYEPIVEKQIIEELPEVHNDDTIQKNNNFEIEIDEFDNKLNEMLDSYAEGNEEEPL